MRKKEKNQNSLAASFQQALAAEDLCAQVFEGFPFPIQIFDPDGTSALVNRCFLEEYQIEDPVAVVGVFNILHDPLVRAYRSEIERAFSGDYVFIPDVKVPTQELAQRHGVETSIQAIYQDISVFPVLSSEEEIKYVVVVMVNRRIYRDREEIMRAKEFIANNCLEKYDAAKAAQAAGLCPSHLARLFKQHTGITLHDYYINCLMEKVKENLTDRNLSVSQAFAACNLDYCEHYARVFKERVGYSPSVYRKMALSRTK